MPSAPPMLDPTAWSETPELVENEVVSANPTATAATFGATTNIDKDDCILWRYPPELRNHIYSFAYANEHRFVVTSSDYDSAAPGKKVSTCKLKTHSLHPCLHLHSQRFIDSLLVSKRFLAEASTVLALLSNFVFLNNKKYSLNAFVKKHRTVTRVMEKLGKEPSIFSLPQHMTTITIEWLDPPKPLQDMSNYFPKLQVFNVHLSGCFNPCWADHKKMQAIRENRRVRVVDALETLGLTQVCKLRGLKRFSMVTYDLEATMIGWRKESAPMWEENIARLEKYILSEVLLPKGPDCDEEVDDSFDLLYG
jgi:hypothetical protein